MKTSATTGAPGPSSLGWFVVLAGVALLWIFRKRLSSASYQASGYPAGY